MTEAEEEAYECGQQQMAATLLSTLIPRLPDGQKNHALLLRELAESRGKIREICEELDIEYSEDRYLPDILERVLDVVAR